MKTNKALVMKAVPADVEGTSAIASRMREILAEIGEDPSRDGLQRTPMRFEKALRFLTSGYEGDVRQLVNGALFDVKYDEIIDMSFVESIRASL